VTSTNGRVYLIGKWEPQQEKLHNKSVGNYKSL